MFQYRDKRGSRRSIFDAARDLSALLRPAGALFLVNDHADIALAAEADGVHLGQDDLPLDRARALLGPGRIIGISTHSVAEAVAAEQGGADYIGFGPLFRTRTKDAGAEQGLGGLDEVRVAVKLPVIAIGGITGETAPEVMRAGADGIAVITAILQAPDIRTACRFLLEGIDRIKP
jgi:thiamine-phosphate pyrophosphorylase